MKSASILFALMMMTPLAADLALGSVQEAAGTPPNIANWSLRMEEASPSASTYPAMAYDSFRGRVVLFGGASSGVRGETWEWDSHAWIKKTPPTSPSTRAYP